MWKLLVILVVIKHEKRESKSQSQDHGKTGGEIWKDGKTGRL